MGGDKKTREEALKVEEVKALILYASERGKYADETVISDLAASLEAYQNSPGYKAGGEVPLNSDLFIKYTRLLKNTYPVTGRTILESKNVMHLLGWDKIVIAVILVILGTLGEAFDYWLMDLPDPEEGLIGYLLNFNKAFLDYVGPFIWGAIGSCVFLFKRLYDLAGDSEFDSTKFKGWYVRILLGAILGAIVYHIYDFSTSGPGEENALDIDENAVAFLTGIGVKVVYGAIEKTVNSMAEKFDLGTVKKKKTRAADTKKLLASKIKATMDNTAIADDTARANVKDLVNIMETLEKDIDEAE